MGFSKKTREIVWKKYGGRCAYCGREIAYKDILRGQDGRRC